MSLKSLSRLIALVASAVSLQGCVVLRVAVASVQSKSAFTACTTDPRVRCEPGSEALARQIAPLLQPAVEAVARAQGAPFAEGVVIYTFATPEAYARHSGADIRTAGAASMGNVNLSPVLLERPGRLDGVLRHELSHVHLLLQMGTDSLAWARVPAWFHEGLATWVSGGGGAETVSPQAAIAALREGRHFTPEPSQWALFPKTASSYGLTPHLFYRQAELFVGFLHDEDPRAFDRLLAALGRKTPFAAALEASYGAALPALWQRFRTASGA